jgi:hypothetical protein
MKKKSDKVTFKPYQMNQMCLPMSLEDLIPETKNTVNTYARLEDGCAMYG